VGAVEGQDSDVADVRGGDVVGFDQRRGRGGGEEADRKPGMAIESREEILGVDECSKCIQPWWVHG